MSEGSRSLIYYPIKGIRTHSWCQTLKVKVNCFWSSLDICMEEKKVFLGHICIIDVRVFVDFLWKIYYIWDTRCNWNQQLIDFMIIHSHCPKLTHLLHGQNRGVKWECSKYHYSAIFQVFDGGTDLHFFQGSDYFWFNTQVKWDITRKACFGLFTIMIFILVINALVDMRNSL